MMKKYIILSILASHVFCFSQNSQTTSMEYLKNTKDKKKFTQQIINLPKDIKIINSVQIIYQDSSGKSNIYKIDVDEAISSDDPLILAKNSTIKQQIRFLSPIIKASLHTIPILSDEEKKIPIIVIKDAPTIYDQPQKIVISPVVELVKKGRWRKSNSFEIKNNFISFFTNDDLYNDIIFITDGRIILDFKNDGTMQDSKTFTIDSLIINSVSFESHKKYYRATIKLKDPKKKYEVKKRIWGHQIMIY